MRIRIPATTANLGPGFDSVGLALEIYLEIEVGMPQKNWFVEHDMVGIPQDETNLIVQSALRVVPDLMPHHLMITSDIPLARGLGSSSSAIIGGIELANELADLSLSVKDKLTIAVDIEGHPDNVAPALLGGLVVSTIKNNHIYYTEHAFPACDLIVVIPPYELSTNSSRSVLPKQITFEQGVRANSVSNVCLSSLLVGDLTTAGDMMMSDEWHEPYRLQLVPELQHIRELKKELDYYGAVLSGAGPTVLVMGRHGSGQLIRQKCQQLFPLCDVQCISVDTRGSQLVK